MIQNDITKVDFLTYPKEEEEQTRLVIHLLQEVQYIYNFQKEKDITSTRQEKIYNNGINNHAH